MEPRRFGGVKRHAQREVLWTESSRNGAPPVRRGEAALVARVVDDAVQAAMEPRRFGGVKLTMRTQCSPMVTPQWSPAGSAG